jgi:UDP-N-acetylglucosamine transferase subunit ALG13
MIFLTVGTHEPFDRLVQAVDGWCGIQRRWDVFGQIADPGPHGFRPRNFEWIDYLPPAEYEARFCSADVIVSHAGMGSIITAMRFGKPIVVLPRRGHLHETRNDHQFASARRLQDRRGIPVAMTERDLSSVLDGLLGSSEHGAIPKINPFAEPRMTSALRAFIFGQALEG